MAEQFLHKPLPNYSTLLSGRLPRDEFSFLSDRLQIWYNDTVTSWQEEKTHYHTDSDEIFILLKGKLLIEVEGKTISLQAGEYCCFGAGVKHRVVQAYPPIQSLMLRAPSIDDKIYQE